MKTIVVAFGGHEWRTRTQLQRAGISSYRLRNALADGTLRIVHPGVYRLGGSRCRRGRR